MRLLQSVTVLNLSLIHILNVKSSKNVLIRPMFIEGLNFARAYHNLPSGKVSVEWQRNGGSIELKVECPQEDVYKRQL